MKKELIGIVVKEKKRGKVEQNLPELNKKKGP
jgi:hypothetical protein